MPPRRLATRLAAELHSPGYRHQWAQGLERQKREHFWINAETAERRYQEERPADLTDEALDRA
jgi:hypothetical protein